MPCLVSSQRLKESEEGGDRGGGDRGGGDRGGRGSRRRGPRRRGVELSRECFDIKILTSLAMNL